MASQTGFTNGLPDKDNYRRFKIRTTQEGDDYQAMKEVVQRRYTGSLAKTMKKPDLIVIDGGKGQLHSAVRVLKEAHLNIPVIALAKEFEEIHVPGQGEPLRIDRKNKGLQVLQAIRDEAHRFALAYQRLLRIKEIGGK
jgi:excinuclease ABC subunit C